MWYIYVCRRNRLRAVEDLWMVCLQIRLFWGPSDGVTSWAGQTAGSQLGQTQRAFCFYNPLMLGTTSSFSLTWSPPPTFLGGAYSTLHFTELKGSETVFGVTSAIGFYARGPVITCWAITPWFHPYPESLVHIGPWGVSHAHLNCLALECKMCRFPD